MVHYLHIDGYLDMYFLAIITANTWVTQYLCHSGQKADPIIWEFRLADAVAIAFPSEILVIKANENMRVYIYVRVSR